MLDVHTVEPPTLTDRFELSDLEPVKLHRLFLQLTENAVRQGFSPLAQLELCQWYHAHGDTKSDLAVRLGVVNSVITEIFKLRGLTEAARERVRAAGRSLSRRKLIQVARRRGEQAQLELLARLLGAGAARPMRRGQPRAKGPVGISTADRGRRFHGEGYDCSVIAEDFLDAAPGDPRGLQVELTVYGGLDDAEIADSLERLAGQFRSDFDTTKGQRELDRGKHENMGNGGA